MILAILDGVCVFWWLLQLPVSDVNSIFNVKILQLIVLVIPTLIDFSWAKTKTKAKTKAFIHSASVQKQTCDEPTNSSTQCNTMGMVCLSLALYRTNKHFVLGFGFVFFLAHEQAITPWLAVAHVLMDFLKVPIARAQCHIVFASNLWWTNCRVTCAEGKESCHSWQVIIIIKTSKTEALQMPSAIEVNVRSRGNF